MANLKAALADRYPEYATTIGTGPMPAGWNTTAEVPLATDLFVNAHQLLERSVDTKRLSAPELADIARLKFAAGLHEDAVHFSDYLLALAWGDPLTRMASFLVHTQPADSEARLREYISRINQIDAATLVRLELAGIEQAAKSIGAQSAGSAARQCDVSLLTPAKQGKDITAELAEDFATHLQRLNLSYETQAALSQAANDASARAIPAACAYIQEFTASRTNAPVGMSQLAEGDEFYRYLLHAYTGGTQSPDAIYAMVEAGLENTGDANGVPDSHSVRPEPLAVQELLNRASSLVLDLDARREEWTDLMPWADLDIRAMPTHMARDCACTTRYFSGTPGNPVATIYFDPAGLGESELIVAVASNTIPGRHLLQVPGLSQEIDIPAYSDGWAAYSATLLGEESGSRVLQRDVYARAAVDIGVHVLGWQPTDAVRFLESKNLSGPVPAPLIVEAIIANPARAASIAVGLDWFVRARQQTLPRWSDREFNNFVLAGGPIPLPALEKALLQRLQIQRLQKQRPQNVAYPNASPSSAN